MKKIMIMLTAACLWLSVAGHALAIEADVLGGVDIHGFISQGYLSSDEYNYLSNDSDGGSFSFNEMGINFGKQVTDKLRLGVQFFARDLGDVANNKITVDWAFADYRWRDWMGLRMGRIKTPRGLFNEIRDMDMLRTCIILPQGIYNDLLRDTVIAVQGGSLYGNVPLGDLGSIDYQALAGSVNVDGESGADKSVDSRLGGVAYSTNAFDMETAYMGSLQWDAPLEGLSLRTYYNQVKGKYGMQIVGGPEADLTLEKSADWLHSIRYTWENLSLFAEYLTQKQETSFLGTSSSKRSESYYLMGTYRFTDLLEAGAYYSETYPDRDDKDGDDLEAAGSPDHGAWQKDLAVFCRFDINEYWVAKIEGHLMDGTAQVLAIDNTDRSEDSWYYLAAKLTFSF